MNCIDPIEAFELGNILGRAPDLIFAIRVTDEQTKAKVRDARKGEAVGNLDILGDLRSLGVKPDLVITNNW